MQNNKLKQNNIEIQEIADFFNNINEVIRVLQKIKNCNNPELKQWLFNYNRNSTNNQQYVKILVKDEEIDLSLEL